MDRIGINGAFYQQDNASANSRVLTYIGEGNTQVNQMGKRGGLASRSWKRCLLFVVH